MSANFIFAKSLSFVPVRACSRFFVSTNFSPCALNRESQPCQRTTAERPTHRLEDESERDSVGSGRLLAKVVDGHNALDVLVHVGLVERDLLGEELGRVLHLAHELQPAERLLLPPVRDLEDADLAGPVRRELDVLAQVHLGDLGHRRRLREQERVGALYMAGGQ